MAEAIRQWPGAGGAVGQRGAPGIPARGDWPSVQGLLRDLGMDWVWAEGERCLESSESGLNLGTEFRECQKEHAGGRGQA